MRVTIRLFARLRDIAGTAEMLREIAPGATIGAVWHELAGEFPALADYERSISTALNADYARMDEMTIETLDRTIEHYFRVPVILAQAVMPGMKAKGAGWIVNIGSTTSMPVTQPFPEYKRRGGDAIYGSMKAALKRPPNPPRPLVLRRAQGAPGRPRGDKLRAPRARRGASWAWASCGESSPSPAARRRRSGFSPRLGPRARWPTSRSTS